MNTVLLKLLIVRVDQEKDKLTNEYRYLTADEEDEVVCAQANVRLPDDGLLSQELLYVSR